MKFDELESMIRENHLYALNKDGEKFIKRFHEYITNMEKAIYNNLCMWVEDKQVAKEMSQKYAVEMIGYVNGNQFATEEFSDMSRLDGMTFGGQNKMDSSVYGYNDKDNLSKYLELYEQ